MRSYSVAVASFAIQASVRWTDNLLSQHRIPEIPVVGRGIARRLSRAAVIRLAIIRELHTALGCGVRESVALAADVLGSDQGVVHLGGHLRLELDRDALVRATDVRLRDALESAPAPRRGRPPKRRSSASS